MRLLFVCSSLEPGRDGVGDHVRLLAEACGRGGHACAVLALGDPFTEVPVESRLETAGGAIPLTRLPAKMPWPERVERARAFREWFRPDWTSFHLVPYAFHPRGILLGLTETLRDAVGGGPLHLMFHEVWLGGGRPTPLRQRVTGAVQRLGIRRLLRQLRPRVVTTSNPVYAAMLRGVGAEARIVPLFGNIPVVETGAAQVAAELGRAGIFPEERGRWWIGLFFGALHAEWKPEPFVTVLERAAQEAGKRIALVRAGRAGSAGEETWRRMEGDYSGRMFFLKLGGEMAPGAISAWLREADFGIAASPWHLLGKSGTVAAMLDHGLPVIVTRDDFQPDAGGDGPASSDPLVHRLDDALPAKLVRGLAKRAPHHRAGEIAAELCAALEGAAPPVP